MREGGGERLRITMGKSPSFVDSDSSCLEYRSNFLKGGRAEVGETLEGTFLSFRFNVKESAVPDAKSCRARTLASEAVLKFESLLASLFLWGTREGDFTALETIALAAARLSRSGEPCR